MLRFVLTEIHEFPSAVFVHLPSKLHYLSLYEIWSVSVMEDILQDMSQ